jgi:anaerobic magnesium-protoporphyrin IX monomethyl ester cyclase
VNVLFIRPNKDAFGFKPIGISLLSAICKKNNHKVALFDTTFFDFGFEEYTVTGSRINKYKPIDWSDYQVEKKKCDLKSELIRVLVEFKPDVCALSLLSDERFIARDISRYIREYNPDIPIIWGGVFPTVSADTTIACEYIDYICVGEGIEALPELLSAIEAGKDGTKIKNIYAKKAGEIFRNENRPLFEDLDSLPYVDWDIFDKRQFYKPFDGNIVVGGDWMSNWGCPYKCTYCINNWLNRLAKRKLRRYSPERAVEELEYLKKKYHLTFMRFHDEDFLMRPLEHLKEFGQLYSDRIGLPFSIETNPHSVTDDKVTILKEMGIASASLAIESGNEYIRKTILKRVDSLDDIVRAFSSFYTKGIRTSSFNMLGLPFEDRSKIFDTIEINRKARPTVADSGFFFPFEATELHDTSVKNNFYKKEEVPIYRRDYPALNQPWMTREELIGLHKCFSLYVKLPKSYYPLIRRAEHNDPVGQELFEILSEIYNDHVFLKGGHFEE